ncbi:MAG: hypothetical protein KGY99_03865 [Phycisphaerae bacterium]|nr:hypothetical protein [Phycisphaerae bacterium]
MSYNAHNVLMTVLGLLAAAVMLWIVLRYLLLFYRAARRGWVETEYIPVTDPNPPEPVTASPGVTVFAVVALVWAVGHLVVIGAWAATGAVWSRTFHHGLVACYLGCAALTTTVGAVMLLRQRRYGRRALAMGQFLFAMVSYMAVVVGVVSLQSPLLRPEHVGPLRLAALAIAGHLGVDTAIGWAAQRVGRQGQAVAV